VAANLWGADVAQLRTLAQQFGKTSETLLRQSSTLTSAINSASAWKGADSARFTSDWNGSHRALIQKTALALKEESKRLLTHADQQEKASNNGSGSSAPGMPGAPGGSGTRPGPWGPDWLAGHDSPFRGGWEIYNLVKALPNLRSGLFDIGAMLTRSRIAGFLDAGAWRTFQNSNEFSKFFNVSNQLFEGRWHEAFNLTEGTKAFRAFDGLGKGLGVLGVGLDSLDAVNAAKDGEYGSAAYSGTKALIGAGSFLPPPAGTVCMVASAGLAIYDNVPIVHDSVNYVGGQIADGAVAVADSVSDGASAVADTVSDGAEAVGDFFGF
jgi:uncharacterized protein YukE